VFNGGYCVGGVWQVGEEADGGTVEDEASWIMENKGVLSWTTLSVNQVDEILTEDVRAGSAVILDCAHVLVGNYYYLTILYCPPTLCCIVVIQQGCAPLADREAFYNQVFHQHRATVGYLVSFLNPSYLETWVCGIIIILSSYQHHNRQNCMLTTHFFYFFRG
jgi:hypothetical protein